ncbi:MAG: hypothetical protein NTV56_04035 [Alphaproteobacteria bacterium]|nr:hypothetical protein [Alphaproteobacteria bacterium]
MTQHAGEGQRFPLAGAFGLYTVAFLALASPWLSGAVEIPYDAASQFYPQLAFLARSLAAGQSPFWTPNIFAGWPQIADPQSLIFSPLHLAVALLVPRPTPWFADVVVFVMLYAGGAGMIMFFRDRGWHVGGALVAALAFAFGGSAASRIQHVGQIESLVFFSLSLWLLARALERSSWRAGVGAGVFAALTVLGRDQVSLLAVYVLSGLVLWHWACGAGWQARIAASAKPLTAGAITGAMIVTVPVTLTLLLAIHSNRPEIGFAAAAGGSLHPANLLMLFFADVFGASDFNRELWGPPGFAWHDAFGQTGLYVAQNTGQIYSGAFVAVAVLGFGVVRGLLWSRDIRFFALALALTLLYALGRYTPVFQLIYDILPGVTRFRRPADATFVLGALLAQTAGYLVHRLLSGSVPPPMRWQRAAEISIATALVAIAAGLALWVGELRSAALPILWGSGFAAAAVAVMVLARRVAPRSALAAAAVLAAFSVADLAWNNAPNESTGLKPALYEALRPDTTDETVTLLKAKLKAAAAPDRRDRVELIGIAYHWPNIGLIHDFDHLFGHNPLRLMDFENATAAPDTVAGVEQRQFPPLMSSYRSVLENLFGVRFIAVGAPVEKVDKSLKPGDLEFIARTKEAHVYENPRALPRVMLATEWREADFSAMVRDGLWPDVDPRRVVLLESAPAGAPNGGAGVTARLVRYDNTEIVIEADAPDGGYAVLNDVWHPWWRATVDGKPTEILKANVLFRAVVVPPGRHVVRFTFHPFAGAFAELKGMLSAVLR